MKTQDAARGVKWCQISLCVQKGFSMQQLIQNKNRTQLFTINTIWG